MRRLRRGKAWRRNRKRRCGGRRHGGPRTRVVPDVVPVGAARRGRRALPWAPWCVCMDAGMACAWCVDMVCIVHDGRGRRPRRPAYTCRPRCRPRGRGAPGTSRPTMGAMVRVHGCGYGVCMMCVHGAWTWCAWCMMVGADVLGGPRPRCRPRCRPRGRGAPGTSRPTMGAMARVPWCVCMVRAWVRTWRAWCMMVGADVLGGPRTRVVPDVVPVCAARRGRRALP